MDTDIARPAEIMIDASADTEVVVGVPGVAFPGAAGMPSLNDANERIQEELLHASLFPSLAERVAIGRYALLERLGQGGMGVVYAAYDPKLDRKVAIKLIHASAAADDRSRARMLREAKAMARLSHPNVAQVYEVGEVAGDLFVAMEFINGQTLADWIVATERPRPWREVLAVFGEAGRGLAAAHAAGLVHRDFKPGNVMLDEGGRARVLDFGLARSGSNELSEGEYHVDKTRKDSRGGAPAEDSRTEDSLTCTGALMGTPAYMPHEQFMSSRVDARSDQFSYCVALYEALYGARPYAGDTIAALVAALAADTVLEPPPGTGVPMWLRRVVLRGLLNDPARRWPSMDALLDALSDDPSTRRRARLAGAGAVVLIGLAAWGAFVVIDAEARACSEMKVHLAGVWDDERRREVKDALEGTGLSFASTTWAQVELALDEYTQGWIEAREEACLATRRDEQSVALLDRRMACLDERLARTRAVVEVLAQPDATVATEAVQTVSQLPDLDRCADLDALMAAQPPPEDPELARRVKQLDAELARSEALQWAGQYERSLEIAELVARESVQHEPLQARAWLRKGSAQMSIGQFQEAEATLERAYESALGLGMIGVAASASKHLVYLVGARLFRFAEARGWAKDAGPLARLEGTDKAQAEYLWSIGSMAEWEGEFETARASYERALEIQERRYGAGHLRTASTLTQLGTLASRTQEFARARGLLDQALEIRTRTLGPEHPDIAATLTNLAAVSLQEGAYEDAQELSERALTLAERALGQHHPNVANALHNMSGLAHRMGDLDRARALGQRALDIRERAFGPEHPDIGSSMIGLGGIALARGEHAEARVYHERARDILENTLGPEHPRVASVLVYLAYEAQRVGDLEQARALYERTVAIKEKVYGTEYSDVAFAVAGLAMVESLSGEHQRAVRRFRRVTKILEKTLGPDHPEIGRALNNQGCAEISAGEYRRAGETLQRALALYERTLGPEHASVALVLYNLGDAANGDGEYGDARAYNERSIAIVESALGPEHPRLADPLTSLGRALLGQDTPAKAIPPLERALSIRTTHPGSPVELADTRFALARALWRAPPARGRDRRRAKGLTEQARAAYVDAGDPAEEQIEQLEAWQLER